MLTVVEGRFNAPWTVETGAARIIEIAAKINKFWANLGSIIFEPSRWIARFSRVPAFGVLVSAAAMGFTYLFSELISSAITLPHNVMLCAAIVLHLISGTARGEVL